MKANLFEILLTLFEKTLAQLKQSQQDTDLSLRDITSSEPLVRETKTGIEIQILKQPNPQAIRIFSVDEQLKLTKASHQFLLRITAMGIIPPHIMEIVINRLLFSDSRFVSLQETKWMIRNTLAQTLDPIQLAFLEVVLYFKEDGLSLH